MIEGYLAAWEKYVTFSGRARRRECWGFYLGNVVMSVAIGVLCALLGKAELAAELGGIYSLAALLPSLAVLVRRLHDVGKSGWWCLLALVPLVGQVWLLILLCLDGTPGANEYGESPKA